MTLNMMYRSIFHEISVQSRFTLLDRCLLNYKLNNINSFRDSEILARKMDMNVNVSQNSALNVSIICRSRENEYIYILVNTIASLFSITVNLGSCPVIIFMNVLVIVAIKTRRRLQSTYNILLACLAVTDLAVGVVSQPLFIAQEIYFLSGASLMDYCYLFRLIVYVLLVPNIESLLILFFQFNN